LAGTPDLRVIPLSASPPGAIVRVVNIVGGWGATRRLMEMGVVPGTLVRVVHNRVGPLIIEIRGMRLSIGRGLASKVLVEVQ